MHKSGADSGFPERGLEYRGNPEAGGLGGKEAFIPFHVLKTIYIRTTYILTYHTL